MHRIALPTGALAAAIAIAIVVFHFAIPDGSGAALADVIAAMHKAPWMHVAGTWQQGTSPPTSAEEWMGFQAQVTARKDASGLVEYKDYRTREQRVYKPSTEQVTVTHIADKAPFALGASDALQFLDKVIDGEKLDGAALSTRQDTRDGLAVTVFTLDRAKPDLREHVEILVDPGTNLPFAVESSSTDAAGVPGFHCSVRIDYPPTGPSSIYDLGVPADAVVLTNGADPQLARILDACDAARNAFDRRFIAMRTIAATDTPALPHHAYILYVDGPRYRLESRRSTAVSQDQSAYATATAAGLDSLVRWWTTDPRSELLAITIDDGTRTCDIDFADPNHPQAYLRTSGIPGYDGTDLGRPRINAEFAALVPDDYSRQNNLIRIEQTRCAGDGQIGQIDIFYLDPAKDYLCHRREWTSSHGKRNIMEVQEYARTPSGRWYPRVELRRGQLPDGNSWTQLLHKIYLSTDTPIPRDTFDAVPFLQR